MKTSKDYQLEIAPMVWAVTTPQNIVMECGFVSKEDAEDFRDNAYCGYYSDCVVELISLLPPQ